MARANTIQTNFTAGEISPLMYGRVDVTKYFNGARKLYNMICLPQGGTFRRPGTQFMGSTKNNGQAIFRKFIISATQTYQLEFGNLYVRFWNSNGQLAVSGTPTEIASPYLITALPYLSFAQSADVLYICHPDYPPYKLSYFSDTSWTLTPVVFTDGPYLDIDTTSNRIQVTVTSDLTTLRSNATGSTTMIAFNITPFLSSSVGKYVEYTVRHRSDGNIIYGLSLVTSFNSTTSVGATIQNNTLLPSFTGAWRTITQSGGTITVSGSPYFNSGSVGNFIRLSGSQSWWLITGVTNQNQATVTAVTIVTYNNTSGTVSAQFSGFQSTDVGKFVEYQNQGFFYLAKVAVFVDTATVKVNVLNNVLVPDNAVNVTVASGANATVSDHSGVFSPHDIGKYIRNTTGTTGVWGVLTAVKDSATATSMIVTMVSNPAYPTITMTLIDDRVISVSVMAFNDVFDPSGITGTMVRVQFGAQWRCVTLSSVSSTTQAIGVMDDFLPYDQTNANFVYNNGFVDQFRVGGWNDINGYPAICGFHASRLWFGRNYNQPTTIWSSNTDDYENMAPTFADGSVLDTNSIQLTIASAEVNPIEWIMSGPVMLIGTQGAEFQLKANSLNQAISPTNSIIVPQTAYGSIDTKQNSVRIGAQSLFVQKGGLKMREMSYDFNIDAFDSKDISIISEHLFRTSQGIVSMDIASNPLSIAWLVLGNGDFICMTYEREQDVIAFTYQELGGGAIVKSVSVIPNPNTNSDDVWFIVQRTVNSATVLWIERFSIVSIYNDASQGPYVDAYTIRTSQTGNVNDSNGWDYLTAASVQVMVDGIYIGTKTVGTTTTPSGKGFNLKYNVTSNVTAGFACPGIVGLLDPEGGSQAGSSQAKLKRISQSYLRVQNSTFPKTARAKSKTNDRQNVHSYTEPDSTDYTRIQPGPVVNSPGVSTPYPAVAASGALEVYTGDIKMSPDDCYTNGGRFQIVQDEPYALKVVALIHELNTNE